MLPFHTSFQAGAPVRTSSHSVLQVLVAEDNPINQRLAIAALVRMGHQGVVVGDGAQAVRCLAQRDFDLILMDVSMPNMDGLEAMDVIRQTERGSGKHTPIVFVTAHDLPGDRDKFLAAGADGYIAKPINFERLQLEIARLLKR